jgi:acid phosphatase
VPHPDHVLVVVFENKNDDQVVGSPAAPYLTSLARAGANLTDAHGERHPSQPNYLALLSGSTQGVRDDSCPQDLGPVPTLASQLAASGHSFVGYSEALPAPGFTGCTSPDGRYARKHNPWVDVSSTPPAANQPLSALPGDLAALPTVAVVIPDLCHDMHDCSVATGDAWVQAHLGAYANWTMTHHSLLIVDFDENDYGPGNHILTIFYGGTVKPGRYGEPITHYSVLRTIEDLYGLRPLGHAAGATPITSVWRPGSQPR